MVSDEHGVQKWRKVEVKLEDHVKVPVFPQGLEQYDECLQEYISSISMEPLPFSKPLWDLSIIKYPTSSAAGTFVFRLHHALGDGYSLMSTLFACLKRTDDPSLPLTFPSSSSSSSSKEKGLPAGRGWSYLSNEFLRLTCACVNGVWDFGWSLMKSSVMEDGVSAIRSGLPFVVESRPINLSYIDFSLDDIKQIKKQVDAVNLLCFIGLHARCIYFDL
ncbi:putative O-acyltransferase, WSD1 [Dioscorea sansibarensis]